MDYSRKIAELKANKGALVTQANAAADAGELDKLTQLNVQIADINNQIKAVEELRAASGGQAAPEAAASPRRRTGARTARSLRWASSCAR